MAIDVDPPNPGKTLADVRKGLEEIARWAWILREESLRLEAATDATQGAALPAGDLDVLAAEVQGMADKLAGWSREIGAGLVGLA